MPDWLSANMNFPLAVKMYFAPFVSAHVPTTLCAARKIPRRHVAPISSAQRLAVATEDALDSRQPAMAVMNAERFNRSGR
jgi:hypothetical protein